MLFLYDCVHVLLYLYPDVSNVFVACERHSTLSLAFVNELLCITLCCVIRAI